MRTCGGKTARQPVSSHRALRCDSGRFAPTTLFTLAQRPRSDSRRTKKPLCLTGMPTISHIRDYKGQRPPG
jgi:hypothetical protein